MGLFITNQDTITTQASQLEESTQTPATAETRRTRKHNRGLNRPTNQSRARPGIPPIRTHLSLERYQSGSPWAPGSSERGLLTQPVQDLLGVGLLAKRPESFRKIRQATKVGSDGSARIPRDPMLLELLEVLELLHRLQRKGEVSILRETCPECEPGCSLLPDCLPEK